jgi:hypothetical protein
VRSITFASMAENPGSSGTKDLGNVVQINIDATDPTNYGYAIHRVEFY